MDDKELEALLLRVENVIDKKVNGGIRDLQKSFDAHVEKVQPIIDAYDGANTFGRFMIWSGKVIAGFLIVGGAIGAVLKFMVFK